MQLDLQEEEQLGLAPLMRDYANIVVVSLVVLAASCVFADIFWLLLCATLFPDLHEPWVKDFVVEAGICVLIALPAALLISRSKKRDP